LKLKHIGAAVATLALAVGGAIAVPLSASAHTPAVSDTCEALTISAQWYETRPGQDAVTEQRLVSEAYDETIVVTPAQDAVYKTEYEFVHKFDIFHLNPKWKDDPNWNAEGNPQSTGWIATGNTRQTLVSPAVPAVTEVVHHDAVYETVEVTPAVPADPTPNTVVVTVNGAEVLNESFGTTFSDTVSFDNKYVANDWTVVITAWNDPDGSKGWTKTFSGTSTPCEIPVVGPNHGATISATCGAATVTLTNEEAEYEDNLTASFTVWVDGEFYGAYAVIGGATEEVDLTFAEDSGDHTVVVRAGDAQGGGVIAEATVESDCIPAQPEDQVVTTEWTDGEYECGDTTVEQTREVTTTPYVLVEGEWVLDTENAVTVEETQTRDLTEAEIEALDCPVPTPPATPVNTDKLAYTGADATPWLLTALGLLLLGTLSIAVPAVARRK